MEKEKPKEEPHTSERRSSSRPTTGREKRSPSQRSEFSSAYGPEEPDGGPEADTGEDSQSHAGRGPPGMELSEVRELLAGKIGMKRALPR